MHLDEIDHRITSFMDKCGILFLKLSLAIIFIWFGIPKPLNLRPAEELVKNTAYWFPPEYFVPILGWWEVLIAKLSLKKL